MEFEEFCIKFGEISHKSSGEKVCLKLNGAQQVVLEHLERCRTTGTPCRLLILKSRQLGISTLLQYYFTWLLLFHCEMETFLSLCHNKQLSMSFVNTMAAIYSRCDEKPRKVGDNEMEDSKGNHLLFGSAKNYNAARGYNIGIAHLSESAFWHSKSSDWSEDVIRSVMGSVGNRAGTFVVMESTSDGKNNFFYKLWRDSNEGMTSYLPIFLSWKLCEYYSIPIEGDENAMLSSLSEREKLLYKQGYTLDQLNWYRAKRQEFQDEAAFLREFPCSPDESFSMSSNLAFTNEELEIYKSMIKPGREIDFSQSMSKEIVCHSGYDFTMWNNENNNLKRQRYYVVVNIGSCVDKTKFNVITCWSLTGSESIELCLERRYFCDIDTLIEDSITVARYYSNAMLIVDVNNLSRLGMSMKEYYIRKLRKKYSRLFMQDGQVGYSLSHKRKMRGLFAFRRRLRQGYIKDYSKFMLEEMSNYIIQDEELSAAIDSHDDVILCRLIFNDVLDEIGPVAPLVNPRELIS